MKKRYFIEFSFLGTHYHGWQIQPNSITVQQRMEEAFSTVLQEETALTGAGRTDSGVHASYFVAHFDCEEIKDLPQFTSKMNRFLSKDIVIFKIREAFPDSHARFDALSRKYTYVVCRKKQAFLGHLAHYH
ncbi:MAG: tRNA pseudouridine(38-40) synthase TruA, partial [Bacteroidota bacterium]